MALNPEGVTQEGEGGFPELSMPSLRDSTIEKIIQPRVHFVHRWATICRPYGTKPVAYYVILLLGNDKRSA